jgi:uncharacterized protein YjbI with pentapeptide repeats
MPPLRARRPPRTAAVRETHARGVLDNATEWRDAWVSSDETIASCSELWISGCVVRDVRFTGADLGAFHVDNTIFERCDFSGVVADSIDVVQSELRDCRMDAFSANGGRWHDVAIERCTLRDVSLRGTTWQHAELAEVMFTRADFTNATFEHARFERCDLTEAQFWHASLGGVSFPGSRLDAVRGGLAFRGTRIELNQVTDVALTVFEGLEIVVVEE